MTSVLTSASAPGITAPPALTVASASGSTTVPRARTMKFPSSLPAMAGAAPPMSAKPKPTMAIALRAVLAMSHPPYLRKLSSLILRDAARLDQSADRTRLLTEIRVWRFLPALLPLRQRLSD